MNRKTFSLDSKNFATKVIDQKDITCLEMDLAFYGKNASFYNHIVKISQFRVFADSWNADLDKIWIINYSKPKGLVTNPISFLPDQLTLGQVSSMCQTQGVLIHRDAGDAIWRILANISPQKLTNDNKFIYLDFNPLTIKGSSIEDNPDDDQIRLKFSIHAGDKEVSSAMAWRSLPYGHFNKIQS